MGGTDKSESNIIFYPKQKQSSTAGTREKLNGMRRKLPTSESHIPPDSISCREGRFMPNPSHLNPESNPRIAGWKRTRYCSCSCRDRIKLYLMKRGAVLRLRALGSSACRGFPVMGSLLSQPSDHWRQDPLLENLFALGRPLPQRRKLLFILLLVLLITTINYSHQACR